MRKKLAELKKYPLILVFFGFIALFSIVDSVYPDRTYSDLENRPLQTTPQISLNGLIDGSYTQSYEKYVNDQFLMRDLWIDIKSRAEYFAGKTENNQIVYGKDNYLFNKMQTYDQDRLDANLLSIKRFGEKYPDQPVYFMAVPNSFSIYPENIPYGLNLVDEKSVIEKMYQQTKDAVQCVDVFTPLEQQKSKEIFYKTDHHWTSEGAYIAYQTFAEQAGLKPVDLSQYPKKQVEDFYGTYYSKTKYFYARPDTITYYEFPIKEIRFEQMNEEKVYTSLYDTEKFETRDKYAAFLYGNNDVTTITVRETKPEDCRRLLVVKDSYANSMIPYLTANYDEITVVDLRSITTKMSELMEQKDFDEVLILYNFESLVESADIAKLKY